MAVIALFVHADRPAACEQAADLIGHLGQQGHEVRLPTDTAAAVGHPHLGCGDAHLGDGLDLAVSLGGDGSMLRAVAFAADSDVPVLGVNFGSLGYLTDVQPDAAQHAVERFFAGDYTIEERTRLRCRTHAGEGAEAEMHALNEVIVEKVDSGRTVHLAVHIDGDYFTSYAADGLIVATPTGSTAYSMSAGGPIVAPGMDAMILTPVAPHTLFDRSLVLPPGSRITIQAQGDRAAAVAVDGRSAGVLAPGSSLDCTASARPARLVTLGPNSFPLALKSTFGLADPPR